MTLGEELLQDQIDRLEADKRDLTNMLALAHQALRDAQEVITRLADGHLDLDEDEDEPARIAADGVVAINAALGKVGAGRAATDGLHPSHEPEYAARVALEHNLNSPTPTDG